MVRTDRREIESKGRSTDPSVDLTRRIVNHARHPSRIQHCLRKVELHPLHAVSALQHRDERFLDCFAFGRADGVVVGRVDELLREGGVVLEVGGQVADVPVCQCGFYA